MRVLCAVLAALALRALGPAAYEGAFLAGGRRVLAPQRGRRAALQASVEAEATEAPPPRPAEEAPNDGILEEARVLLVVSDTNPYLSEGTKAALRHAVGLTAASEGHVTAMVLPVSAADAPAINTTVLQTTLRWWLRESGLGEDQYDELLPQEVAVTAAAVADAADELGSTQVVVSADSVARKDLDVSLLATFLNCPLTMVPE